MIIINIKGDMDTRQQNNPAVSSDDWYTPKWIIDTLGPFDCDPCAPPCRGAPIPDSTDSLQQGQRRTGTRVAGYRVDEPTLQPSAAAPVLRKDGSLWQRHSSAGKSSGQPAVARGNIPIGQVDDIYAPSCKVYPT